MELGEQESGSERRKEAGMRQMVVTHLAGRQDKQQNKENPAFSLEDLDSQSAAVLLHGAAGSPVLLSHSVIS